MALIKFFKVTSLPATLEANAFYYVKESGNAVSGWLTDNAGTAYAINNADSVVNSVNGLNGNVTLDLSFSGGQLGITGRDGNKVNLDIRYMKIGDHISWGYIDGKPTTVSGYGINDVYTKSQADAITGLLTNLNTSNRSNLVAAINELNGALADQLQVPEAIDCSGNPDYPASVKGDTYKVTVAGKIGGASGIDVNTGDLIICTVTNSGGDQAAAGSNFFIVESNISDATTTVKGIGRIATQAEVDAGSEAKAWVTPLTLANVIDDYYTKTESDGKYLQSESDPVFNASPAAGITASDITNWDAAEANVQADWNEANSSSDAFIKNKPAIPSSLDSLTDVAAATPADGDLLKFNDTTGEWENWTPDFLTSYTESDPVFSSSPAAGITSADVDKWGTALQPGDNNSNLNNDAGYLTDDALENTLQQGSSNGTLLDLEAVDLNNLTEKSNVIYNQASGTNNPITSNGGVVLTLLGEAGAPVGAQIWAGLSEDQFFVRGRSSGAFTSWFHMASRDWVQSQSYLTSVPDSYLQEGDNISKLNNDAGYLTSFTETDPTVSLFTKNLTDNSSVLTAVKAVDGAGSGLDADLLDGKQGSYYLNYNNLTNTPTIPDEYELPIATSSILGGIKVGTRLSVTAQGTLSADNQMVWASTEW